MTRNKTLPYIIGIIIIAVGAIVVMAKHSAKTETIVPVSTETATSEPTTSAPHESIKPSTNPTVTPPTSTPTQAPGTYTLAQVALHNNKADCWTTINGGVYNVTSWIPDHPGGSQVIIGLCGKDGSAAFNGQHGGQARPASELASFKIGALVK